MLNTLRKRLQGEEGFTLIELLVVILIIGILAAIAIPSFLNQKGKGEDSAAKSSARSGQTALETYYTDNQTYDCSAVPASGSWALGCDSGLHQIEGSLPSYSTTSPTPGGDMVVTNNGANNALGSGNPTSSTYRVAVASNPSGRIFWIDKSGTQVTRGCYVPAGASNGGCKNVANSYGTW